MTEPRDLLLDTEPKDLLLVVEQLRRSNRRWKTLVLAACALLLLVAHFGVMRAEAERTRAEAALRAERQARAAEPSKSQLAKDLIGTWAYAGMPDDVKEPPEGGGHYKYFTRKHFCVTKADPETGKVEYHHGGTYTLDGDNLEETVTYATEATAGQIGQTFKFKIKVEGDTYTQTGIGNPYNEVWKRAK
jgi:hypothetical protein